ncbi:MAG: hypothetical protein ACM3KR_05085 [Deltaproteobacteria bacterium]
MILSANEERRLLENSLNILRGGKKMLESLIKAPETEYEHFKYIAFCSAMIEKFSDIPERANSVAVFQETRDHLTDVVCHNFGILHPKDYSIENPIPLPAGKHIYWHEWYAIQTEKLREFEKALQAKLEAIKLAAETGKPLTFKFANNEPDQDAIYEEFNTLCEFAKLHGYSLGKLQIRGNTAFTSVTVIEPIFAESPNV